MKSSYSWNFAQVLSFPSREKLTAGGGLIDFMNTRLRDRLTESEILKIFGDVAQGVACMHYLQPPLLHRDIKVDLKIYFLTLG
jgi:serine/threonine protein kinase